MARFLFAVGVFALAVAWTALTWSRLDAYRDELALWANCLTADELEALNQSLQAHAFIDRGDNRQAMLHLARSIELDPKRSWAQYNMGCVLNRLNRYAEAIPYFESAVATNPSSIESHTNLGIALMNVGEWNKASEHFELALLQRPDNVPMLLNLMDAYIAAGKKQEAQAVATRAKTVAEQKHKAELLKTIEAKLAWLGANQ